jgi:CHASE2 domain-containing sensor protein
LISYPLKWENIRPRPHICNDPNQELQSFGLRLALTLFKPGRDQTRNQLNLKKYLLNNQILTPLDPNGGGYVKIWEDDYQILLDYRSRISSQ